MRGLWRSRSRYEKALIIIFLLTLPFIRRQIQPDGQGYYAYLRSPLIDHNFQFASDWNDPPEKMLLLCGPCSDEVKQYWNHPARSILVVTLNHKAYANPITRTGHLPNFYTVGPALLWAPFVIPTHGAVLVADTLGAKISTDGHSWPYVAAICFATGIYGFLGLWFSFQLAKRYAEENWAFWATVGIWFASSLPVYMYLDATWSHAHSAFTVAVYLWYWDRTRGTRTPKQWFVLGLLSGLMVDVYLPNAIFALAPVVEIVETYLRTSPKFAANVKPIKASLLFAAGGFLAFLPMLVSRQIVYGNPLILGIYAKVPWNWRNAAFLAVLFSKEHGLFVWTPILLAAFLGLFALWRRDRLLLRVSLLTSFLFYCLIAVYPWWDGTIAYGNRFFVSLTPIFVLGLASGMSLATKLWDSSRAASWRFVPVTAMLILWNFGLIFQWTTHMVPTPGEVHWDEVLYNQFRVVPGQLLRDLGTGFSQIHELPKPR